jgi:hypothetical protein
VGGLDCGGGGGEFLNCRVVVAVVVVALAGSIAILLITWEFNREITVPFWKPSKAVSEPPSFVRQLISVDGWRMCEGVEWCRIVSKKTLLNFRGLAWERVVWEGRLDVSVGYVDDERLEREREREFYQLG